MSAWENFSVQNISAQSLKFTFVMRRWWRHNATKPLLSSWNLGSDKSSGGGGGYGIEGCLQARYRLCFYCLMRAFLTLSEAASRFTRVHSFAYSGGGGGTLLVGFAKNKLDLKRGKIIFRARARACFWQWTFKCLFALGKDSGIWGGLLWVLHVNKDVFYFWIRLFMRLPKLFCWQNCRRNVFSWHCQVRGYIKKQRLNEGLRFIDVSKTRRCDNVSERFLNCESFYNLFCIFPTQKGVCICGKIRHTSRHRRHRCHR